MMSRTRTEAESMAHDYIMGATVLGTAASLIPVAGGTLSVAVDLAMARKVADIFGIGFFDFDAVKAHLATALGTAIVGKAAMGLLHLIPGVGQGICLLTSARITYRAGELLIEYFRERSPLPE